MAHDYLYKGSIDTVDSDERTVLLVKKHPFGIIQLYIASAVGLFMAVIFMAFFVTADISESMVAILLATGLIIGVFMVFVLIVATWIYYANKLIITNKNITQVIQRGLFSRKVSQLSMTNVEDVTADQHGFFATMFNYGILKIETAGEQANFHFTYTPDCNSVAKQVLEARERYIEYDPDRAERANNSLHVHGSGKGGRVYNTPDQDPSNSSEQPEDQPQVPNPPLH